MISGTAIAKQLREELKVHVTELQVGLVLLPLSTVVGILCSSGVWARALAHKVRGSLQEEHSVTPGLAVVLVGERPDSATYVRMKKKAAAEIGFHSIGAEQGS